MQTHRDFAGASLDQSDDRRVAVARRHEVDQCDPPVHGAEDRLQHHGAITVRATDMRCRISGVDTPPPVVRGAEQSREAGTTVADATLSFLRETVPRNWANLCDSVTDNFRVISPKDFR